jgi:DNA-directed RNA polymerase specialized sigma24 family protein
MTTGYQDVTDGQLLDAFVERGDQAAFTDLVERHGAMATRAAHNVLRDHHEAQDVAQAVFLVLARKAGRLRGSATIAPWLYRVAHDLAVNAVRQREHQLAREQEFVVMDQSASENSLLAPVQTWLGFGLSPALACNRGRGGERQSRPRTPYFIFLLRLFGP